MYGNLKAACCLSKKPRLLVYECALFSCPQIPPPVRSVIVKKKKRKSGSGTGSTNIWMDARTMNRLQTCLRKIQFSCHFSFLDAPIPSCFSWHGCGAKLKLQKSCDSALQTQDLPLNTVVFRDFKTFPSEEQCNQELLFLFL